MPPVRLRLLNQRPLKANGAWVLYWMTSFRRAQSNFSLDRALEHARALERPLLVLEALRLGYPFASDRLHAFVLQGMADNARRFKGHPVHYFPYVEPAAEAGKGLVEALAARACVVVTDDWPCLFVPRMQAALAARVDVSVEAVDSNGLFPMRATERSFTTAHSFRTHLQKELKRHLGELPHPAPLQRLALPQLRDLPRDITSRWPPASPELLASEPAVLERLPIDHSVAPVSMQGGSTAALKRLAHFVARSLDAYPEARNEPGLDGTSKLSAYLHFGHLSTHEVFAALIRKEAWSPEQLGPSIGGARAGWWQLPRPTEALLDQLVTWRELAFNAAAQRPSDFATLDSLPSWAKASHAEHRKDPRPHHYSLAQLARAETHDPLWNAAQRQLTRDGWFHGYLRMLWGKKLLQWSTGPEEALANMEHLMGRYCLDGRDPVSWSGYLWVLGRFDRPWGPQRPIFGTVRYMSSENTARKLDVKAYLARYGP